MKAKGDLRARLLGLLGAERIEVRAAAALVLGQIGGGEKGVTEALVARLADPSPMMVGFVLEALEAVEATGLAGALLPLLGAADGTVAERARRLLEREGAAADRPLARALAEGAPPLRRQAAHLLARRRSAAAIDALLAALPDPEVGEHALQLLRAELDRDKTLAALVEGRAAAGAKEAWKGIGKKHVDPVVEPRLGALLRLLGYLASVEHLGLLVDAVDERRPRGVRLAGLAALRRLVAIAGLKGGEKAIHAVIGCARDEDAAIARAAVDTLRGAAIPDKLKKEFASLAKDAGVDAKKLAMERMPSLGASGQVSTLLANLAGKDPGARDAAGRALAAAPEAAGAIAKALVETDDVELARRLAYALRSHEGRVPKAGLEALQARVEGGKSERGIETALLEAIAALDPGRHVEILFARAQKLAKADKVSEAFAVLRPVARTRATLDEEQRIFLGVLGLKAAGRDLLRAARGVDPVLSQFQALVAQGTPVAGRLLKRKDVSAEELFVLGFNFVESDDAEEKALGVELLEGVVERGPRAKLGVAAKNKLRLVGELE